MPMADMDAISSANNTWLTIGQINSDPERQTDHILRVLNQVLKYKKLLKIEQYTNTTKKKMHTYLSYIQKRFKNTVVNVDETN
jgi:hypothetical protein